MKIDDINFEDFILRLNPEGNVYKYDVFMKILASITADLNLDISSNQVMMVLDDLGYECLYSGSFAGPRVMAKASTDGALVLYAKGK